MKEDYLKVLKKLTSFSLSNPVPFTGQSYQKQKGCGTSDQPLFSLRKKFRKIPLFVIYYLTKFVDVIPRIIPKMSYSKNSTFICPFELKKWKGQKLQNFEYPENEKSFLNEIKNIFHSF